MFLGAIDCQDKDKPWEVHFLIGGTRVNFKIDSGADVTVMPQPVYNKLKCRPHLLPVETKFNSPGGPLQCVGRFVAKVVYKETKFSFNVYVVQSDVPQCLLSRSVASL